MNAGPGRPSGGGGGGGRRRRRGRRPHNQRGQRPGPGLSRENKDGIYTAPMDHSYRAALAGGNNGNGHKGGRQRPGFATQYPQPEPEPLPANNEDANSRIFAFIEDLFFMAKIQETARKLNVKVEFVKTDKELMEKMSAKWRRETVADHFRSEPRQRETADPDSEAEEQAEEGHVDYRIPVACAGRSEAEGARSGLRHGSAAVGFFAEPAAVAAQAWSTRGYGTDGAVDIVLV